MDIPHKKRVIKNKVLIFGAMLLLIGSGFAVFADEPRVSNKERASQEIERAPDEDEVEDLAIQEEDSPVSVRDEELEIWAKAYMPPEEPHPALINLGEYKITFYCKCAKCCGKSDGITATGTVAKSNRTIAVNPKVIPYGSVVIIDGREYIAEDTGGFTGKTIDVFVDSHEEALSRGVMRREIFVVSPKK